MGITQFNKYIKHKTSTDSFPNENDFVVWLMSSEKKSHKQSLDILKGYKGLIYTYSIAYLENKIGKGGRNSGNFVQLLAQYKRESELNINTND